MADHDKDPDDWVPSPRHLLRLACIHHVTSEWTPGTVLEVGAGTGHITREFVDRGFDVTATDLGDTSRELLRQRFGSTARVVDSYEDVAEASMEHLFAFEVLEHVADDHGVLAQWTTRLRPGGKLLISVPAHQSKFGDADRAVGHVRRYERDELLALVEGAGYEDVEIANYGFPLGNVLRHAQTLGRRAAGKQADDAADETERVERTMDSGVKTAEPLNKARRILRPSVFAPFAAIQKVAYGRDWSDGYVLTARRS